MKKIFFAVAAMLVGSLAHADSDGSRTAAKIRNPSASLTSLHAEALIPILSQMGYQYEGATLPSGEKVLLVTTNTGMRFQITPMACDRSRRCRGMHLVTMFQTDVDRRTVMAFNDRYAFVSAGLSSDDTAYLARYEIADYGMPRGNVAVSIEVFLETASLFTDHLEAATGKLRQPPQAGDLAANGLNMGRLMQSVSIDASPRDFVPHPHALSFEETNDIVQTYVRAETIYPGKIVNHLGN